MLQGIVNTMGIKWANDEASQKAPAPLKQDAFAQALAEANNKDAVSSSAKASGLEPEKVERDAVQSFLEYQNMSMAEKVRMAYLASKNLTEEDVEAMSAAEREKLEEDIREAIKRKLDPNHI